LRCGLDPLQGVFDPLVLCGVLLPLVFFQGECFRFSRMGGSSFCGWPDRGFELRVVWFWLLLGESLIKLVVKSMSDAAHFCHILVPEFVLLSLPALNSN
jgi:hypothetical protein